MTSDCECAPKSLCECIRKACAQASADVSAKPAHRSAAPPRSASGLGWLFRGPARANVFAVAATLMLVAGAILFGIFGRSIDDVPRLTTADLVSRAAVAASGQHDECTSGKMTTPEQTRTLAQTQLTSYLKVDPPIQVFDFDDLGYKFIGSNACDMRLPERCGQLVYKSTKPGEHTPMVSVFIVPNRGECGKMCNGGDLSRWSAAEAAVKCNHRVMYSNDRRLIYFLVCCNENDLDALSQRIAQTLKSK